jgi:hypothetical protein
MTDIQVCKAEDHYDVAQPIILLHSLKKVVFEDCILDEVAWRNALASLNVLTRCQLEGKFPMPQWLEDIKNLGALDAKFLRTKTSRGQALSRTHRFTSLTSLSIGGE